MMFGTCEEFEYFLCCECGCLQIRQIPSALSNYYPPDYYSLSQRPKPPPYKPYPKAVLEKFRVTHALFGQRRMLAQFAAYFVDYPSEWDQYRAFLQHCELTGWNARFLDVGCGSHSWWLDGLSRLGFHDLTGVDPNIAESSVYSNIHILKGQIGEISGKFDVITLHHSLEHIPDQLGTMQAVKALMKPSSVCIVRLPLVSSMVWEMYGTDWVELDAPRHLYLHSLRSVELLGKNAGLRLNYTTWDSTAFEFYGSEQYRRGIPLFAENSFGRCPDRSDFTYREMAHFSALAERANREGRGGRGCFYFRLANA
jgi:hypothetical protein